MSGMIANEFGAIAARMAEIAAERDRAVRGAATEPACATSGWPECPVELAELIASLTYGSVLMDGSYPVAADA